MASTYTTTSTITKPVNVIFQQTLLRNAKALCPYFAGSVPAEVQENAGTFTATWRRIENLTPTTTALSELTSTVAFPTRDSVAPTITNVSAAVAKYGQVIYLSEEVDLVNYSGQNAKLAEIIGRSAGQSLNRLQRNEMEDNATLVRAGGVASDGVIISKITAASIASVVNTLARNDAMPFVPGSNGSTSIGTVPILPGYWGACHPDVAYDIANITGFVGVEKYAGQTETVAGEFGLLASAGFSVRFVQTSDASIDLSTGKAGAASASLRTGGSNKVDLYSTPIWSEDAVGSLGFGIKHTKEIYRAGDKLPAIQVIVKEAGSAGSADPLNEVRTIGWKSWHAAKILNSGWIRAVRSGATSL